jgi:solute carrier family 45 protein 1/2/4
MGNTEERPSLNEDHASVGPKLQSTDDVPHLEPAESPRSINEPPGSKSRRDRLSHLARVLTAPTVVFGCSFALALQFTLLTPLALRFGVSQRAASFVWLMGPVTGLIVQPLIGHLSDIFHRKHATRLPIVYLSAGLLVLSHFGIVSALAVQDLPVISPLALVIVSFWLFDACVNAMVVTTRAMLSDRFCSSDRTSAFAVLQFWTSMGFLLGYLTAASPGGQPLEASATRCFLISAMLIIVSTSFSILSVRDKRACRMRFHTIHTGEKFSFNTACLLSIVAGSSLTWFGWFAQQVFSSQFLATTVHMDGSMESLRLSAFGLVISSGLSCITGLIVVPLILSITGSDSLTLFRMWSLSSICQGLDLAFSPLVRTPAGALLWEAAAGPMYAIALSVPYMLVANGCDHGSTGRVMALVNVAVCFPQLIVSLSGGLIVAISGGYHSTLFCIGGFLSFVAGYLLWVPIGEEVPPWSIKSARVSIVASTSDWISPGMGLLPRERIRGVPSYIPPLPRGEPPLIRLTGLSSPRAGSVIPTQLSV